MAVKIEKKITGYAVVGADDKDKAAAATPVAREAAESELPTAEVIHMHERIERPEVLVGSTYKIKSPLVEHAMYVTINDIVLNLGSEQDRKSVVEGKRVSVRVDLGGRRINKQKTKNTKTKQKSKNTK